MLVLKRHSHVCPLLSHTDIYPEAVPVFLRPGPDMQECETRMSACTWQPQAGSGTKPGPVRVGGMARSVCGGWGGTQAWALGEAGPCFRSSLTPQRGRHVGQERAVSREKAGGHGRPAVSTLSLGRWQEGWEPRHTIGH